MLQLSFQRTILFRCATFPTFASRHVEGKFSTQLRRNAGRPTVGASTFTSIHGRDARKAAATRSWLATAFVAAARKRQDFASARLLAIRPAAPSLEDFAAAHDPDGFYSEQELLDLFAAQHAGAGADAGATLRRQQRNARLRAADGGARGARPPGGRGSAPRAPRARLVRHRRRAASGRRRPHHDRQAGRDHQHGRLPLVSACAAPRLAAAGPVTAIVPLERFLLPPELDGSHATHRNLVKNHSRAHNDREAIDFWLADYENPHTRQRYRTEAERLLLWAIFVKRKALSSLDTDDARDYINGFLPDPQPASQWVMTGTAPGDSLEWRPFRGPLSLKSRQDALSALKKFFGEVVDAQYLDHNAFAKVRVSRGPRTTPPATSAAWPRNRACRSSAA